MEMMSGLSMNSFKNMQLNAGIFLKNFDYSSIADASALATAIESAFEQDGKVIGATTGGGAFNATPEMRTIEADGMRYPFIGSQVIDSWEIKMTGTMKEITPANFASALAATDVTTSGKKTTIKIRNTIKDSDYIDKIVWVGNMNDGSLVLIAIFNALNTTGANFTFTDKGEGTLPFEFKAHAEELGEDTAPCEIVFFGKPSSAT